MLVLYESFNKKIYECITHISDIYVILFNYPVVQLYLFEKTRMVRRAEGEPTFHVLYNLLAGIGPQLRHDLDVEAVDEPNLFFTPLQRVRFHSFASSQ